jgi:hypothetical protein
MVPNESSLFRLCEMTRHRAQEVQIQKAFLPVGFPASSAIDLRRQSWNVLEELEEAAILISGLGLLRRGESHVVS